MEAWDCRCRHDRHLCCYHRLDLHDPLSDTGSRCDRLPCTATCRCIDMYTAMRKCWCARGIALIQPARMRARRTAHIRPAQRVQTRLACAMYTHNRAIPMQQAHVHLRVGLYAVLLSVLILGLCMGICIDRCLELCIGRLFFRVAPFENRCRPTI